MTDFAQTLLDGIMTGATYGLVALGFTLIFGVMRRLNLSYGPSLMAGAYLGTLLYWHLGAGAPVVAAATVLGAVLTGLYVERLCFAPFRADAAAASMVSSFAIWMQIEQAAVLALPRHTYPFPALASGMLDLAHLSVRIDHAIVLVCALTLAACLAALLYGTRFGLALRAVIENPTAAQLVGIDVGRSSLQAFALASAIGGLAGYLVLAVDQQVTPMFGMWATMKGLIAMMLGGLGSLAGAMAGGFLLGIVEAHAQWLFGPQIRDLCAYLLLFVFLTFRPGGLLGSVPLHPASGRHRGL